uniref:Uncharacterized protein n=1 Tax=Sphaerodactylus townsendi TaxID=933632 RepID=A0ACB8FM25_9SAUR
MGGTTTTLSLPIHIPRKHDCPTQVTVGTALHQFQTTQERISKKENEKMGKLGYFGLFLLGCLVFGSSGVPVEDNGIHQASKKYSRFHALRQVREFAGYVARNSLGLIQPARSVALFDHFESLDGFYFLRRNPGNEAVRVQKVAPRSLKQQPLEVPPRSAESWPRLSSPQRKSNLGPSWAALSSAHLLLAVEKVARFRLGRGLERVTKRDQILLAPPIQW